MVSKSKELRMRQGQVVAVVVVATFAVVVVEIVTDSRS